MDKIKLFTDSDLDGSGCAIIAKLAFGDNVDIEYCSPKTINQKFEDYLINTSQFATYDKTFITDLSISKELAIVVEEKEIDINLFDHHTTAEYLNDFKWAAVNVKTKIDDNCINDWRLSQFIKEEDGNYYYRHCGTSLFYDYVKFSFRHTANRITSDFVELVRQYDTWTWTYTKCQIAKDLSGVFGVLKIDDFVDEYVKEINSMISKFDLYNNMFEIKENHLELLKYKRKDIDSYIAYKIDKIIIKETQYGKAGIVLCDRQDCTSELGNKMCNELDIDYAMLIYDGGISLRSKGNFDVSVIAKANGGGGHKNSAGFKFDVMENITSNIINESPTI
jgi:oligoribonuclease NrnB/cAMP/cGMP phosphodiesterase (DHH superfamily)